MIRVTIADDHQLFADGLYQALNSLPDTRVVGIVNSGPDLEAALDSQPSEVCVVDIEMPLGDGIEAIAELGRRSKAIVVSMHASDEQKLRAQKAGAKGFFSKAVPLTTLAAAIRAVAGGEDLMILDDEERDEVLERHMKAQLDPGAAALTPREIEILQLLAVGVSATDELAERLFISQKTVKNHLASIFQKLAVADRTQAAIEAIRLGLARPQ
ncbi:MAG TPA: response regulator transcription factor [Acidimicrobiia bacterium]